MQVRKIRVFVYLLIKIRKKTFLRYCVELLCILWRITLLGIQKQFYDIKQKLAWLRLTGSINNLLFLLVVQSGVIKIGNLRLFNLIRKNVIVRLIFYIVKVTACSVQYIDQIQYKHKSKKWKSVIRLIFHKQWNVLIPTKVTES